MSKKKASKNDNHKLITVYIHQEMFRLMNIRKAISGESYKSQIAKGLSRYLSEKGITVDLIDTFEKSIEP